MKRYDYAVTGLSLLASIILLTLSTCYIDTVMFALWLAAIAVFILAMNHRKLKKRRLARRIKSDPAQSWGSAQ